MVEWDTCRGGKDQEAPWEEGRGRYGDGVEWRTDSLCTYEGAGSMLVHPWCCNLALHTGQLCREEGCSIWPKTLVTTSTIIGY